jgi:DNA-binding NarL/FixJ family response regulator
MRRQTIVLVDDHDLVRLGIRDFLASSPAFNVVGEARTAREAFQVIESARPDIVLMDIAMPGMDGVVATRELLRRRPETRVLILSAYDSLHDVTDALNAGAFGYARKADAPEALMLALERVARGVRHFPPTVTARLGPLETPPLSSDVLGTLSGREREIFRLAADCRTAPEIARQLCLSRKTVDTHLNRIHRKLGISGRAQLVRLAAGIGMVHSIRGRSEPTAGTDVTDAEVASPGRTRTPN